MADKAKFKAPGVKDKSKDGKDKSGKPKKEKLTKKQKALLAKLAAEKAKEQEKERLECEQMGRAESESIAYEREFKYQTEERERIEWEEADISQWIRDLEKRTADHYRKIRENSKWRRFVEASKRLNPLVESEVNTWISLWKERDELPLEDTINSSQEAEEAIKEIHDLVLAAIEKIDESSFLKATNQVNHIRDFESDLIDRMTAYVIQRADDFANQKGEVYLGYRTSDIEYGLWVNITKNPRIKRLDFPNVKLCLVDLPKQLALTSIAVRMMHYAYDLMSHKHLTDIMPLGGVFFLEILALPPPPKKVKGWTLRPVTQLSTNVSRLGYPPTASLDSVLAVQNANKTGTAAAAVPPLKVSYNITSDVFLREDVPTIGWWDPEVNQWKTDGISEVEYVPAERLLTFKTMHVGALAIIQNRYADLPLVSWKLRPVGPNEALLHLRTRGRREFKIFVGDGFCRLHQVQDEVLRPFEAGRFKPIELLERLRTAGVNLLPTEHAAKSLADLVTPKDNAMERKLYREFARLVASYALTNSKWNNQRYFVSKCIFRAKECLSWEEEEEDVYVETPQPLTPVLSSAADPSPSARTPVSTRSTAPTEGAPADASAAGSDAAPTPEKAADASAPADVAPSAAESPAPPAAAESETPEAPAAPAQLTVTPAPEVQPLPVATPTVSRLDVPPPITISTSQSIAPVDEKSPWTTVVFQERSCILVKVTDNSIKYNEDMLDDVKIHQHAYHCLKARATSDETLRRMRGYSVGFVETMHLLLNLLRPLSFTK
eukprot:TRINITY_DN11471_c0_g1_i1.p1 TRINITY_DN11471_c0_g1~~TRINITY_DN11471_c0_g1_i1.p1  ORF type:complete len:777 (+),score=322.16 TRINITY_DN11471_c0_g1_i1:111-2441(+)